jgi:hypothetical protein
MLCERAGEPLAGSAGLDALSVSVAWPKALWHAGDAARSQGLPAGLGDVLADAKAARRGLKLRLFQREPDPPRDRVEVVAAGAGLAVRVDRVPLDALAECVRMLALGEAPPGAQPLGPEILVCTDGKHDRCCAEYGFALYRALAQESLRRGSLVRVAESSHLGGHRFAANCLVLPALELYGRLEASHAAALLDAVEERRVLGAHLRGRLGTEELVQVAEAWLHQAHPRLSLDRALVLHQDGSTARVEVLAGSQRFPLRCHAREFLGPSSCGEAPEPRLRWVADLDR